MNRVWDFPYFDIPFDTLRQSLKTPYKGCRKPYSNFEQSLGIGILHYSNEKILSEVRCMFVGEDCVMLILYLLPAFHTSSADRHPLGI